ncbi:MAG: DUF4442 domain-containing protein [Leptospiraceae bacterium]|nr:DUF4442 domain-containing protein [Leptospiraceae bacterium]MDW8307640.1 DUF4442 domain-containing protein [Leptospiraceae bacterium]
MKYQIYPLWQFMREHYTFEEAFSLFGPFTGANIRCRRIDPYTIESYMDLVPANTNYVGTHFGGSLYAMCDPFFMFLLMEHLGPDYIVWDQRASIDFLKPARARVKATFHIPPQRIADIQQNLTKKRKSHEVFSCDIIEESNGRIVAHVEKVLYVRRRARSEDS